MLVFTRLRDDVSVIVLPDGTEIEVCVVDIIYDKVKLGFTADKAIKIHRKEVWETIKAQNTEKAQKVPIKK